MNNRLTAFTKPFASLKNQVFAGLYFAESISLLGDAFTWVGLALLSYQFGKERSAVILATALTLRVAAFIIFSPFAGVLADRISRKAILCTTHFSRMAIVACLPVVDHEWQIYVLVFLLNVFNAFFTPTYNSVIPQVIDQPHYQSVQASGGCCTTTGRLKRRAIVARILKVRLRSFGNVSGTLTCVFVQAGREPAGGL